MPKINSNLISFFTFMADNNRYPVLIGDKLLVDTKRFIETWKSDVKLLDHSNQDYVKIIEMLEASLEKDQPIVAFPAKASSLENLPYVNIQLLCPKSLLIDLLENSNIVTNVDWANGFAIIKKESLVVKSLREDLVARLKIPFMLKTMLPEDIMLNIVEKSAMDSIYIETDYKAVEVPQTIYDKLNESMSGETFLPPSFSSLVKVISLLMKGTHSPQQVEDIMYKLNKYPSATTSFNRIVPNTEIEIPSQTELESNVVKLPTTDSKISDDIEIADGQTAIENEEEDEQTFIEKMKSVKVKKEDMLKISFIVKETLNLVKKNGVPKDKKSLAVFLGRMIYIVYQSSKNDTEQDQKQLIQ